MVAFRMSQPGSVMPAPRTRLPYVTTWLGASTLPALIVTAYRGRDSQRRGNDEMSLSNTPNAHSEIRRSFRYMQTNPEINAGFEEIQLTPKASNSRPEILSKDSNTKIQLNIAGSTFENKSSAGKTGFGGPRIGHKASPSSETLVDESEDSSEDYSAFMTPKPIRCTSKRSPRTPLKAVKKSPRAKTPNPTPRKKSALDSSVMMVLNPDSPSNQVFESPQSLTSPATSVPRKLVEIDDLPIFGARYSKTGNSSKLFISKGKTEAMISGDLSRNWDGISAGMGLGGQRLKQGTSPPTKRRAQDIGKDGKESKKTKL